MIPRFLCLPVLRGSTLLQLCVVALAAVSPLGCATDGAYIWVDDLSPAALKPPPYRLHAGDRIFVSVWNQPPLSGEVLVRPDGAVTMPLIGDVAVLGMTPEEVSEEVGKRLTGLVVDPNVTCSLTLSAKEPSVSVMGEVRAAGSYPLHSGEGVLELLARAGGLSEFADGSRIFVLRKVDATRVRFAYDKLAQADGPGVMYTLQDGDVIVVR